MARIMVVFDFDKMIIEHDSDNWVLDRLGFTDLFNQLLPTMPLNPLMDIMMKEVHAQGKAIEDVKEVLNRVPIHPRIVPTIKIAYALDAGGCRWRTKPNRQARKPAEAERVVAAKEKKSASSKHNVKIVEPNKVAKPQEDDESSDDDFIFEDDDDYEEL